MPEEYLQGEATLDISPRQLLLLISIRQSGNCGNWTTHLEDWEYILWKANLDIKI